MAHDAADKAKQKKDDSKIIVSVPHFDKGDDTIEFFTDTWKGKTQLAKRLDELKSGGKMLALQRGTELTQIQGYDPKDHAWITGTKAANAGLEAVKEGDAIKIEAKSEPVKKGDKVNVVVPQSGG